MRVVGAALVSIGLLTLSPIFTPATAQDTVVVRSQLVRVSRDGAFEDLEPGWIGDFRSIALSPDGRRVAISIRRDPVPRGQIRTQDLWVKDLSDGSLKKLTSGGPQNNRPFWTPDGKSISFRSDRARQGDLFTVALQGVPSAETQFDAPIEISGGVWTPDGQALVAQLNRSPTQSDIVMVPAGKTGTPVALLASDLDEHSPAISPDGRWMAYVSTESGKPEVYVRPFPNVDQGKWLVSAGGGAEPTWARSGREIFYRNGANEIVAVAVGTASGFKSEAPRVLFSAAGYHRATYFPSYWPTPDDAHFIMIRNIPGR